MTKSLSTNDLIVDVIVIIQLKCLGYAI